jgi:hypothetical protein
MAIPLNVAGFPIQKLQSRVLHLHVFDYDRFSRDDSIGEVFLPLCQVSCLLDVFSFAKHSAYIPPGLTFINSTFCPHSVFMCFVWISEQAAIIFLYSINRFVLVMEVECVYCAV